MERERGFEPRRNTIGSKRAIRLQQHTNKPYKNPTIFVRQFSGTAHMRAGISEDPAFNRRSYPKPFTEIQENVAGTWNGVPAYMPTLSVYKSCINHA